MRKVFEALGWVLAAYLVYALVVWGGIAAMASVRGTNSSKLDAEAEFFMECRGRVVLKALPPFPDVVVVSRATDQARCEEEVP